MAEQDDSPRPDASTAGAVGRSNTANMFVFDQTPSRHLVTLTQVLMDANAPTFAKVDMRRNTKRNRVAVVTILLTCSAALAAAADVHKPPAAPTPRQAEYRLGPEDVIEVFVWKEPELTTTVVIRPDGRISLPLANELEASGKTAVELQQEITARLSTYVVHPVVNVMVKQVNSLKIERCAASVSYQLFDVDFDSLRARRRTS